MSSRAIAALLAQDYSLQEIAEQLGYEVEDVKTVVSSPMVKKLAKQLKKEGAKGVDLFMAEDLTYSLEEDYDMDGIAEEAFRIWEKNNA